MWEDFQKIVQKLHQKMSKKLDSKEIKGKFVEIFLKIVKKCATNGAK